MRLLWINLLQAVRSMRRHARQTFLSVLELSVELVCFTFSANWLWYETHYESFRPDYRNIHAVYQKDKDGLHNYYNPYPLFCWLRDSVPTVTQVSCVGQEWVNELSAGDGRDISRQLETLTVVHPEFLSMCGVRFLYGNPATAFSSPDACLLTRSKAVQIFGRADAVGETMVYRKDGREWVLRVTGVVADEPPHTQWAYGALVSMELMGEGWRSGWSTNAWQILFKAADVEAVNRRLAVYRAPGRDSVFGSSPVRFMPVMSGVGDIWDGLKRPLLFGIVSLLLLVSAVFNYMALLTSGCMERRREYCLRVSLGGSFRANALWLYSEVGLVVLSSLLCAAVGVEMAADWSGMAAPCSTIFSAFGCIIPVFVAAMLLSALYPLFYVRRQACCRRHAGTCRSDGRMPLLFVQVAVCALLVFVFAAMYRQYSMMVDGNRGFRHERVVRLFTRNDPFTPELVASLVQELQQRGAADVEDVVALSSSIFQSCDYGALGIWTEESPDSLLRPNHILLSPRAIDFFGIRPISGSIYTQAEADGMRQLLVNKAMADLLPAGHAEPGCVLRSHDAVYRICGVVDFQVFALTDKRSLPFVYEYTDDPSGAPRHEALFLRYREGHRDQAIALLRGLLQEHQVPEKNITMSELGDFIRSFYEDDAHYLRLFTVMTAGGVFVAFFGVFSLAGFVLATRRRDIAVRRIFGASGISLCCRYLREYLVVTLLGCLAALPIAVWLTDLWMRNFSLTVEVGWLHYAGITLLLLALVAAVVLLILWKTLRENPAEVIREE